MSHDKDMDLIGELWRAEHPDLPLYKDTGLIEPSLQFWQTIRELDKNQTDFLSEILKGNANVGPGISQ